MANEVVSRADRVAFIAHPLWIVRLIGLLLLALGLLIIYQAVQGNITVHDDFLNYARKAGLFERFLIGALGFGLAMLGAVLAETRSYIELNGDACEASVKHACCGIPFKFERRSCRNFTSVRVAQWTFVTRCFSMISFRITLEGGVEEPLWLGDFMGVELPGGKTFFVGLASSYEKAHACAESAATILRLPLKAA